MSPGTWEKFWDVVALLFMAVVCGGIVIHYAIQTYFDLRDYWRKRQS